MIHQMIAIKNFSELKIILTDVRDGTNTSEMGTNTSVLTSLVFYGEK